MLCFYSLFDALKDDIVLPFRHILIEGQIQSNKNECLMNEQLFEKIVNEHIISNDDLPYKKGIAWCSKISNIYYFKDMFIRKLSNTDVFHTTCNDKNFNELDTFYKKDKHALLLCVNKCREGSDIKNLDYCMYLNNVKNRSLLVALQTSGRVIRKDNERRKKYALIIECIYRGCNSETYELFSASKVLEYYKSILEFGNTSNNYSSNLLFEMYQNTIIDEEKRIISIPIDNNISHNCVLKIEIKDFDWRKLRLKIKDLVNNQIYIDNIEKLKREYKHAVTKNKELEIINKDDYEKKKIEYFLDKYPEKKYKHIWNGWYEYLGIDTSNFIKDKEQWKKYCRKINITSIEDYYIKTWGFYEVINGNDNIGYKVKKITVYPGKRLSLQSHEKRSEHWVVVSGNVRVQIEQNFYEGWYNINRSGDSGFGI